MIYMFRQSDAVLLADVFENFSNKCIEAYELDPPFFFVRLRISMAGMYKKQQQKNRCRIRIAD